MEYGDDFLDPSPKALFVKEIIDKLIKMKNFCSIKDNEKTRHRLEENNCKRSNKEISL